MSRARPRRRHGPIGRDDRRDPEAGNIAVMVALLLTVFLVVAALSVDAGAGWALQRALITEVDAAALAGAQRAAEERQPCDGDDLIPGLEVPIRGIVNDTIRANDGQSGATVTDPTCQGGVLTVEVRSSRRAARFVAAEGLVAEASAVARAVPRIGGRVIPLTLCLDDLPPGPGEQQLPYTDGSCGGAGGTWGWFGGSGRGTIAQRIPDPDFADLVDIGPGDPPSCTVGSDGGTAAGWCNGLDEAGNTEAGDGALLSPLAELECAELTAASECELLTVLLHGEVDAVEGDVRAAFRPVGFADVVLREVVDVWDEAASDPTGTQLTLEFVGPPRLGAGAIMTADPRAYLCNVEDGPSEERCTLP